MTPLERSAYGKSVHFEIPARSPEERRIALRIEEWIEAHNARDGARVARCLAPDAVIRSLTARVEFAGHAYPHEIRRLMSPCRLVHFNRVRILLLSDKAHAHGALTVFPELGRPRSFPYALEFALGEDGWRIMRARYGTVPGAPAPLA